MLLVALASRVRGLLVESQQAAQLIPGGLAREGTAAVDRVVEHIGLHQASWMSPWRAPPGWRGSPRCSAPCSARRGGRSPRSAGGRWRLPWVVDIVERPVPLWP